MKKIKRTVMILMLVFLAVSTAGCDKGSKQNIRDTKGAEEGSKSGKNDEKYEEYDWRKAKENTVGAEAYRRVDACGEYRFDPEGRAYIDGKMLTGEWVKTDEKVFGDELPNKYETRIWDIEDSYSPGEKMDVDLTFRVDYENIKDSDDIWGSMYFADLNGTDGDLGNKLAVRKYFGKSQNDDTYDPVEMSRFGKDNDGRNGSAKGSDGDIEYYYDARATFPRLCAQGDKIYVVLDISDAKDNIITRHLWEYTYEASDPGSKAEDAQEYVPTEEDYPEFYSIEYPGRWDMTDIRFIGGNGDEVKDSDVTVKAERYGVEGEDMVYTFKGSDESYSRIYVPDFHPDSSVYAGGSFYAWIRNTDYRVPEDAEGKLHCSLALADVDFNKGKYGVKVNPRQYFDTMTSSLSDEKTFDAPGKISFMDSFPAGKEDGEKIYLAYGVMDGFSGGVRMYNIYEYTYTMGPVTEWVHNPPMPD